MGKAYVLTSTCMLALFAGCGAGSAELKTARSTAYDVKVADVWNATIEALKGDYPVVRVLDKDAKRIVTCWRVVDRDTSTNVDAKWRLFRLTVEISAERPYRVAVAGRSADFAQPQIRPFGDDDAGAPGWTDARTERVVLDIHERLKAHAVPATGDLKAPANPTSPETWNDTCVIRPELILAGTKMLGMTGIPIGERGAMLLSD